MIASAPIPTFKSVQIFLESDQLNVFVDILFTEDPELLVADQIQFHDLLFKIFKKENTNEISTHITSKSNNEATYQIKMKLNGNS